MKRQKKYNRYISYQTKLTLFFTVMSVSIIIAFATAMFKRQEKNLSDTMHRTIQVENQKNAVALSNVFESIRDLAGALALNDSIRNSIEELPYIVGRTDLEALSVQQDIFRTMLISKLATMSQMIDMRLYSRNGMCAYVTRQRSGIEEGDYWERDWFEAFVINDRDWMFSFSRDGDIPVLTFSRTVRRGPTAVLTGYLEVNFDFSEEVRDILDATSLEGDSRYYLLEKKKLMLSNDEMAADIQQQEVSGELKVLTDCFYREKGVWEGTVCSVNIDGADYLLSASCVENTNYVLISGTVASTLKAQTRGEYRLLFFILLPGTMIALGISFYAARGLSRNIQKLNKAMKDAELKPDIQVEITSRDEIGMLGDSFNRMIRKLHKTYSDLYAAEMDLKEAQNLALQAQINPHFLYNTLETIDALSICERTEDIGKVVQSLSKVFRYAMEEQSSVPLREEAAHVREYLQILEIRYENRFTWNIELEESVAQLEVPKIILQPLVENAIIHGVLKGESRGRLEVHMGLKDGCAVLSVMDTGVGMDKDTLEALRSKLESEPDREERRSHIGVQNVDRRLRYFFGERYHLEMNSRVGIGTTMTICICLDEEMPGSGRDTEPFRHNDRI